MNTNFKMGTSVSIEELENRYEMSAFASGDLMEVDCKKNCDPVNSTQEVGRGDNGSDNTCC